MSLFLPDWNDDSSSRAYTAPRKTGFRRLWTIFTRDTPGLLGAGLLAVLSSLVYIVGLMISIDSHALLPMLLACPLGGMLAAPQLCGMADTILRSLRDDASAWWVVYRRAWKRNVKGTLLPGALGGLLFGFQMFILAHIGRLHLEWFLLLAMLLGIAVAIAIATWLLPQLALMDLPLSHALLNAMLLCVRHPLRTLGAVLIQLAYWGSIALIFPYSLVIFLILNFWLPMLISIMMIYEPLNETFHIEEEIEALHEALDKKLP